MDRYYYCFNEKVSLWLIDNGAIIIKNPITKELYNFTQHGEKYYKFLDGYEFRILLSEIYSKRVPKIEYV